VKILKNICLSNVFSLLASTFFSYHLTRLAPKIILVVNRNTRNYIIQSYYCAEWHIKVMLAVRGGEAHEYYSPTVLTEGDWSMIVGDFTH
jgi:hypothetical protein